MSAVTIAIAMVIHDRAMVCRGRSTLNAQRSTLRATLRYRPEVAHHRQHDVRRSLWCAIDLHRRRSVIRRLCVEDVRDERLWIAIDDREPGTLYLYHDPVT